MKKRYIVFIITIVVLILLVESCAPAGIPAPTQTPTHDISKGKSLVQSRCSTCHGLAQVQAAKYDRAGWESLVSRMVGNGAQLTSEQQQLVVDYLAKTYPKD